MKKTISLILALVLCLSLCACGGNTNPTTGEITPTATMPTSPAIIATEPPTIPGMPEDNTTETKEYETIEITTENWQEYFEREVLKAAFKQTDMWGEVTEWVQEHEVLKLKDEYAQRVNWALGEVAVRYVCNGNEIDFIMEESTTYERIELDSDSRTAEIGEYKWYGLGESPDEGPGWDPWNETAEVIKVKGTLVLSVGQ